MGKILKEKNKTIIIWIFIIMLYVQLETFSELCKFILLLDYLVCVRMETSSELCNFIFDFIFLF
jgi:hypothetical protein